MRSLVVYASRSFISDAALFKVWHTRKLRGQQRFSTCNNVLELLFVFFHILSRHLKKKNQIQEYSATKSNKSEYIVRILTLNILLKRWQYRLPYPSHWTGRRVCLLEQCASSPGRPGRGRPGQEAPSPCPHSRTTPSARSACPPATGLRLFWAEARLINWTR